MMIHNRNILLSVTLTVVFCAVVIVVSAQKPQKLPSAILVKNKCINCIMFDTICQFQYGDIVLTVDSITFRNMKCIHDYDDQDTRYGFLHNTYLIFSFPNGKKYTMELFDWYSSFIPEYAPVIYRRDWGNTLPIDPTFFQKDWTKSLKKFVKKWNSYKGQEEVVLNILECGANYSRMIQIQGNDTIVTGEDYYEPDLEFDLPSPDDPDFTLFADITDGDTIYRFPEHFPTFSGGIDSLNAFLLRETHYPNDPFLDAVGTVLVRFVVEKDGSVRNPVVKTSLHPKCDEEAVRVIMSMPKWHPGTVRGIPIRCYYEVPVIFRR